MSARSPRLLAVALAAFGLLLVGCGGGGNGAETTGTLTKAQFLKQGNAICAKGTKEFGKGDVAFWKQHGGPQANASQALTNELQLTVVLPIRKRELREIRALGTPKGDEPYVEKMLAAWEEGIQTGEEEPASLDSGGPNYAFYKSYSMGIDYGLTKCWLG
jgi:hypothetical protein